MDSRIALNEQTKLSFCGKDHEKILYTVVREIGRGASCIVYEVSHETTTGDIKLYRLKECYPYKLNIGRDSSGRLVPSEEDRQLFEELQEKMKSDFRVANALFYSEGAMGMYTDQLNVYEYNGTTYIVSAFSAEKTLADYQPTTVKECISLVKQVAYAIGKIHQQGFIYLDTKPNNVLVVESWQNRIQLFDFDSLIGLDELRKENLKYSDFRLSYSKGFAPVELQTARLKHIGKYTDVYGVGALLFYLLFGHAPTALDCEEDAIYLFQQMRFDCKNCDDKLFGELTRFFHKSLANYYMDRYSDMRAVCDKLQQIEIFADVMIPRLFSTKLSEEYVVGREKEFERIDEFISDTGSNCLFVTGMRGIGKSTLVRGYIQKRRHKFDTVLYMLYSGNMESTITSDKNIRINTLKAEESGAFNVRYFDKKIQKIRELVDNTKTLIVIDNFYGEIDKDALDVLQSEWKVILVSRQRARYVNGRELQVGAIANICNLQRIFERYVGAPVGSAEQSVFENIVERVQGHTYVVELIAKLIARKRISISKASELVEDYGFLNMAPEKVDYEKDGKTGEATIGKIIDELFEESSLSEEKRLFLKVFSLIGTEGIDIHLFHKILHIESMNDVNDLISEGWLTIVGNTLSMHAVIQDTVSRQEWTEKSKEYAKNLLSYFFVEIRIESTKNDYPKKLHDLIELSENIIRNNKCERPIGKKMISWRDAYIEKSFQNGIAGMAQREQYARINDISPADIMKMYENIWIAEQIVLQCKRIDVIKEMDIYTELLYQIVLNMPPYREGYIFDEAKKIFSESKDDFVISKTKELLESKNSRNAITRMKLYRKVAMLYASKEEYDSMKKTVDEAKNIERYNKCSQVSALYYDLLSEYYDALLGGAYDATTDEEKRLLHELLKSINSTIRYAKKHRRSDGDHLYSKNLLAKATVLMRSGIGTDEEVEKLIDLAKKEIIKNTLPYAEVRLQYYLVRAWYHAFVTNNLSGTEAAIRLAQELATQIAPTQLDVIDKTIIPCANIYLEMQHYEKAINLLNDGIKICLEHESLIVYRRKREELCRYLRNVAERSDKPDVYLPLIERIDSDNEEPQNRKTFSMALGALSFAHSIISK